MLSVMAVGLLACHAVHSAEASRPNIVLILADDMGYSDLGCYGGEIDTRNLDSLAAGGVRFTQFYNGARCCPTRASLMTGLYPHAAGMGSMTPTKDVVKGPSYQGYITKNAVTIAEVLHEAGYLTAMAGKWHAGNYNETQWPENRGFSKFYGIHHWVDSYWKVLPQCDVYRDGRIAVSETANPKNELHPDQEFYTTNVFTDWALKYINDAQATKKPLFLYVAYNSPHWPLEAPDEDIAKYKGTYDDGWTVLREQKLARMKQLGIVPEHTRLSEQEAPAWDSLGEDDRKNTLFRREIYAAQIDRMDQNVGRIVDELKRNGMLDNTLILFLSDNGCSNERGMFGYNFKNYRKDNFADWRKASGRSASQGTAWSNVSNTPFRKHKRWAYEGGMRTPLIAHWPAGLKNPGRISQEPGHLVDVMSTCVEVAGAQYPTQYKGNRIKPTPGLSLIPILQGKERQSHRAIYCEHWHSASIRAGNWKLVTSDYRKPADWQLFNLAADPSETRDLKPQEPERAQALFNQFKTWANEVQVKPEPKWTK